MLVLCCCTNTWSLQGTKIAISGLFKEILVDMRGSVQIVLSRPGLPSCWP